MCVQFYKQMCATHTLINVIRQNKFPCLTNSLSLDTMKAILGLYNMKQIFAVIY